MYEDDYAYWGYGNDLKNSPPHLKIFPFKRGTYHEIRWVLVLLSKLELSYGVNHAKHSNHLSWNK